MASYKSLILVCVMVAAMATVSNAQVPILGSLINGTLFCTANGSALNGTATPPFANATVQLVTALGTVLATTVTNSTGGFSFFLSPLINLITTLLGSTLRVVTPLSACNPALASVTGLLTSTLQLTGIVTTLLGTIFTLIPTVFRLV